jgi:hypothetical protein
VKRISLVIGLATLLTAGAVYAGVKGQNGVTANATSRVGAGNVSDARNGGDAYSRIQVEVYGSTSYQGANAMFWDASNNFAYCWTNNAQMVQLLSSIKGDSSITAYWDSTGQCSSVYVTTDSAVAPKAP